MKLSIISFSLQVTLLIGLISMSAFGDSSASHTSIAATIKRHYEDHLRNFISELNTLKNLENQGVSETKLIPSFLKTREAYKHIEYLLVYNENQETTGFNGANLLINEYTAATPSDGIEPHGLQVIEDLLYQPNGEQSRATLKNEIERLIQLSETFLNRSVQYTLTDSKNYCVLIWDAMRFELYRIESLGITGFDVPNSENALPETNAALQSIQTVIGYYRPLFAKQKNKSELTKGEKLVKSARTFLTENPDFNSFDRLTFIREYLHPISIWLGENSIELDLIFPENVSPINRNAKHLFDRTIFNPAYFASTTSPEKIELGKQLFNDRIMSGNGERSCASCHYKRKGYADGLKQNVAINSNEPLLRNTPSLWNVAFQTKLFYDSRVTSLEKQSLAVIHNPLEMGGNFDTILEKINKQESYREAFMRIYNQKATQLNVIDALSCFTQSLISFDSRFDQYIRSEGDDLSESEKAGFNLFAGKAKCATCHFIPLFNGLVPPKYKETESEILGVPISAKGKPTLDPDQGKFLYTGLDIHAYAFKTSGIRNSELTAPYMHNGVFATLEEVVEFYNNGGGIGAGISLEYQTLPSDSLKLSKKEVNEIVSFIKSLTDESLRN